MEVITIERLLEQLLCGQPTVTHTGKSPTFLSVIGRRYDEDLISRVLAYCLSADTGLLKNLIQHYICSHTHAEPPPDLSVLREVSVHPEKIMGPGRADIFVTLVDASKRPITVTIENKIFSWEHSTGIKPQTQVYRDWVTRAYPDAFHTFFYLRPDYNLSVAACEDYLNITYAQLAALMENSDDTIARDLLDHITQYLRGDNIMFNDTDRLLLNHYKLLEEKKKEATNKLLAYQELLIRRVEERMGVPIAPWQEDTAPAEALLSEVIHFGAGIGSYRLYRPAWYRAEAYYFYVEIKFEDGCPDKVSYQCTVRDDEKGRQEHNLSRFFDTLPEARVQQDGKYNVMRQTLLYDRQWGTDEWEERFVQQSVEHLTRYIGLMDELFAEYCQFDNAQA